MTAKEYQLIKNHVIAGAEFLGEIGFFRSLRDIMVYHHEKYDGTGYPEGLAGEEIPLLSRIMAVADSFEAITTNRIYKKRKAIGIALEERRIAAAPISTRRSSEYAVHALRDVTEENSVRHLPVSDSDFERMAYSESFIFRASRNEFVPLPRGSEKIAGYLNRTAEQLRKDRITLVSETVDLDDRETRERLRF